MISRRQPPGKFSCQGQKQMNGTFSTADGLQLAYYVDDFTDPWRKPDTVLLLHAAMGSSRRWF